MSSQKTDDSSKQKESDRKISMLYRAYCTVHEMLSDRGLKVEKTQRFEDFRKMVLQDEDTTKELDEEQYKRVNVIAIKEDEMETYNVNVIFYGPKKLNRKNAEKLAKDCIDKGARELIIVCISGYEKSCLMLSSAFEEQSSPCFLQFFNLNELVINITHHHLVPKHTVLSDAERKELMKTFNITDTFVLPKMMSDDPVAKYFGMRKGDVCSIERLSETAGIYLSYRVVV